MAKKVIQTQNADGTFTLENAATEEAIRELGKVIDIFKKGSFKKDELDSQMGKSMQTEALKHTSLAQSNNDTSKKSAGFLKGIFGEVTAFAGRAYDQNIDLSKDVEGMTKILGNTVGGVASIFGKLGKSVGTTVQAVADVSSKYFAGGVAELEKYRESMQKASASGVTFGGDLLELKKASGQMRMSISEFTAVVHNEGRTLAGIGLTVDDGFRTLASMTDQFNTTMKKSSIGLMNLGMTNEDINKMLRSQISQNRRLDYEDQGTRQRQLTATVRLSKEMDAVSRLTGIQREELQKAIDEQMRKAEVEATIMQMDMDGSKGVREAYKQSIASVSQYGPGAVKALEEIFTQGTVTSEEGINALNAMGSAGDELTQMALRLRQGGDPKDLISNFGVAMMERMKEADFLSLSKMGALGVDIGKSAGEMLMSGGGALRDALYKMAQDPANEGKTTAELYLEAQKQVEQSQKDQMSMVEEQDTLGKKLNVTLNTLEDTVRTTGTQLSTFTVNAANDLGFLSDAADLAGSGLFKLTSNISGLKPLEQIKDGMEWATDTAGEAWSGLKEMFNKKNDTVATRALEMREKEILALINNQSSEMTREEAEEQVETKDYEALIRQADKRERQQKELQIVQEAEGARQAELNKKIIFLREKMINELVAGGSTIQEATDAAQKINWQAELQKTEAEASQKTVGDTVVDKVAETTASLTSSVKDLFADTNTFVENVLNTNTSTLSSITTDNQSFITENTNAVSQISQKNSEAISSITTENQSFITENTNAISQISQRNSEAISSITTDNETFLSNTLSEIKSYQSSLLNSLIDNNNKNDNFISDFQNLKESNNNNTESNDNDYNLLDQYSDILKEETDIKPSIEIKDIVVNTDIKPSVEIKEPLLPPTPFTNQAKLGNNNTSDTTATRDLNNNYEEIKTDLTEKQEELYEIYKASNTLLEQIKKNTEAQTNILTQIELGTKYIAGMNQTQVNLTRQTNTQPSIGQY